MQLAPARIGDGLIPKWIAAGALVKDNGIDAAGWTSKAIKTDDPSARLDFAVRTMTSLDHAIDATRQLPLGMVIKGVDMFYAGYDAAKLAVSTLIASDVIPGARVRVGLQNLVAAKEEFLRGISTSASDLSDFGSHVARGWVSYSIEDATSGVMMLRDQAIARPLVAGLEQVRALVANSQPVSPALVTSISAMFDKAAGGLKRTIAETPASTKQLDPAALDALQTRTAELLAIAGRGADAAATSKITRSSGAPAA